MAERALVICKKCRNLRRPGKPCPHCSYFPEESGWVRGKPMGSSYARGYDRQWGRLREEYLSAHPLCEQCLREGRVVVATTVDHIKPFQGRGDPLRLCWENLQSLCEGCRAKKSGREGARANARKKRR